MGQLPVLAEAPGGNAAAGPLLHLGSRHEPAERAFGGEGAGSHRVHADPVGGPLHREGPGQGQHAGLGHRGGEHEGRARLRVVGDDGQHLALLLALDEAPADLAGAVERPVEHDAHHRVKGVGGQVLGRREEVPGRVVDHLVHGTQLALHGVHRGADGVGVTDVAGHGGRAASRLADGPRRLLEGRGTAAQDGDARPQPAHADGHGPAQPAAAAGDDRGLAREQVLAEWLHAISSQGGSIRPTRTCVTLS